MVETPQAGISGRGTAGVCGPGDLGGTERPHNDGVGNLGTVMKQHFFLPVSL